MHYGVITACFSRVACLACLLLAAVMSAGKAQACQDDGVLVLGRITDDPQRHYEQLRPLLDYVVPRMREVGIREGRILMAREPDRPLLHLYLAAPRCIAHISSGKVSEPEQGQEPVRFIFPRKVVSLLSVNERQIEVLILSLP